MTWTRSRQDPDSFGNSKAFFSPMGSSISMQKSFIKVAIAAKISSRANESKRPSIVSEQPRKQRAITQPPQTRVTEQLSLQTLSCHVLVTVPTKHQSNFSSSQGLEPAGCVILK